MTDNLIDDHLVFDEFWMSYGDRDRRNERLATLLPAEKEQWIAATFADETFKLRNKDVWEACEAAGTTVGDLTTYISLNPGHLKRKLDKGTASESELWLAVQLAGLDDRELMVTPTARHRFVGKNRTVGMFKHLCDTVELPIDMVNRTPVDASLSPAHAALLQSILSDADAGNRWFHLTVPVANDFTQVDSLPWLKSFIESIFSSALHVEGLDEAEITFLTAWSPQRVGCQRALGGIARVWNRYQMHWFLASEVISGI